MKNRSDKARVTIEAAGGIVVRDGRAPLIAVVQLRKSDEWVLPKGKLNPDEDALAAARREVVEETGHDVSVHEYLGAISYDVRDRPKVVQFWRMQAVGGPARELARDVKAVQWLPLGRAIGTLTHPREQAFLRNVGPRALEPAARAAFELAAPSPIPVDVVERSAPGMIAGKFWAWLRAMMSRRG